MRDLGRTAPGSLQFSPGSVWNSLGMWMKRSNCVPWCGNPGWGGRRGGSRHQLKSFLTPSLIPQGWAGWCADTEGRRLIQDARRSLLLLLWDCLSAHTGFWVSTWLSATLSGDRDLWEGPCPMDLPFPRESQAMQNKLPALEITGRL